MITKKYSFQVGEVVELKVDVKDQSERRIPAGTLLKIVAITPKVYYTPKYYIEKFPETHDSKEYFFNACPVDEKDTTSNRIREHFVTVKKG